MKILKTALVLVSLLTAAAAHAGEAFEACTPDGCALHVTDSDTGSDVWLVTDEASPLQDVWNGTYWLVSSEDYAAALAMIPEDQRVILPLVNPTTGLRVKGGAAPGGKPGGPLVGASVSVGNITIGGQQDSCVACHTGSLKDIHKKVLEKKGG